MNHEETPQELVSVPPTLRTQIDRAHSLLAQSADAERRGDTEIAVIRAKQGLQIVNTIAERHPELSAMLLAPQMGFSGFSVDTYEQIDRYEIMEEKFLGVTVCKSVVNVPYMRKTHQQYRFIP